MYFTCIAVFAVPLTHSVVLLTQRSKTLTLYCFAVTALDAYRSIFFVAFFPRAFMFLSALVCCVRIIAICSIALGYSGGARLSASMDSDGSPPSPSLEKSRRTRNKHFSDTFVEEGGDENVRVCIRVRPFNHRELELQKLSAEKGPLRSVVAMPDGMAGRVVFYEKQPNSSDYRQGDEFQYTKTFWSVPEEQQPHNFAPVSQEDVYDSIGRPMIRFAFAGFHNCVFAYGQTGSGKTHTMMGEFEGQITPGAGLIPRLCVELFEKVDAQRDIKEEGIIKTIEVKLSAVEIYNEQVRDLFWRMTPGRTKGHVLKIRKHPADGSFFVDQLTVLSPASWLECLRLIEKAVDERTVAATDMNDESSRSHCIFQLVLEQTETVHVVSDNPDDRYAKPVTNKKVSKINLVDLAGSERLKKSNAQGQQLKEAAGINLSLTTLKKVIDALVANSKETNPKKHVLIPFRESSLTLLLADSLGGNSKTTMIACVSPHYDNQEETLLTLKYANRTGTIVNHARINEDSAAKQALRLKHEILEMQRRLAEGPIDEEAEELQDQIDIGRRSLKEMEEANKKAMMTAEELRKKAREEEEAILSSAFYNSMKMALLQQQREQMEQNAAEMEERIRHYAQESESLATAIKEKETEEKSQLKVLERLRRDTQMQRMKELEQERQNGKLSREASEAQRKMEREIEMRYAQKMINAYRLRKAKEASAKEMDEKSGEHDAQLALVITEAAEQYELQVRQFADAETIVHQRTTKLEKEIHQCTAKRQECEQEASQLMLTIRNAEKTHVESIQAIERQWKEKYQSFKDEYEERIRVKELEYFEIQKRRDAELEQQARSMSSGQEDQMKHLENARREAELQWNDKVLQLVEAKADEMESMLHALQREHAIAAAKKRKEYEGRISELVAQLKHVELLAKEHDDCADELERALAPLMHLHDAISVGCSPDGDLISASSIASRYAGYSQEYIELRKLLVRFDGNVKSVKPVLYRDRIAAVQSPDPAAPRGTLPVEIGYQGPVFPYAPVGRVKLSKMSYADAQAMLSATVGQSVARTSEPLRSSPQLLRRQSSMSRGPSKSLTPGGASSPISPAPRSPQTKR